jgi:hypothetical protein
LVAEHIAARDDFFDALNAVTPESMTTPGLVGEWSARELVAHLGYWAGNATETIHRFAEGGGGPEDGRSVDEINATVARIARQTEMSTVLKREAASFAALVERIEQIDPSLLEERLPDGQTLVASVREDGSEHYRDHAEELRRVLGEAPRG